MSDDDEIMYVKKQKTIHYGSLEDTFEARLKQKRNDPGESNNPNTTATIVPEYIDIELEM